MKTTFDTDSILFRLLNGSPLKTEINGGIYCGDDRPENSELEDVCINSIDLTQDYLPQLGTSNVNIYVSDTTKKIAGKQQLKANRTRLKELAEMAIATLKQANVPDLNVIVTSQTTLAESTIKQHYVNIRIEWFICS